MNTCLAHLFLLNTAAPITLTMPAPKQAGAQLPPVNVIKPDTLPQCLEFQ